MNRQREQILRVILSFACLLCIAMAFLYGKEGEERENVRTLQLKDAYDTKAGYELLAVQKVNGQESDNSGMDTSKSSMEPVEFVIWGELPGTSVSSRELNRSTAAALVTVCGDSRIIFSSSETLGDEGYIPGGGEGKVPSRGREKVCLISPALALELFGNADGFGQKIELGEDEFQVQGTLNCEDPVMLVTASLNPGAELDKLSVKTAEGTEPDEGLAIFTEQTGIQGDILSFHLYHQWAQFMIYAIPFLIYFAVWLQMVRRMRKSSLNPALGVPLLFLGAVISAGAGIWILDIHIKIPRTMLPSMWSDFDFWSGLWKRTEQHLSLLMKTGKSEMALFDYRNFLKAGGYSIAAGLLGCLSLSRLEIKNSVFLWTAAAGSMVVTYLFFAVNMQSSVSLADNRILWMLIPACFIMKYLEYKIQEETQ
ncbi:MAG: ABC transporter permease [Eubacteriales bacterium]|nr:ABC transporter permease [Eubacteriales bacterium]